MDIMRIIEIMDEQRITNAANLSIGEMLDKLNTFDEKEEVKFLNGLYFGGGWGSYRGYYKDAFIEHDTEDRGKNAVKDLKDVLLKALDKGEMEGYKGGEYRVNRNTLLWFATYGCCGDMIVDILKINGQIIVITKEDRW